MKILHIMKASVWETEKEKPLIGQTYLDVEGFIHCSTVDGFRPISERFRDRIEPFVLLVLDTDKLTCPIRWEGRDVRYPHLYGPIDRDAVTDVLPYRKDKDGAWRVPEQLLTADA